MTKQNNIYSSIRRDELSDDMGLLADLCGLDNIQKIMEAYHGLSFYVPQVTYHHKFIMRYLKEHRNQPIKKLAVYLGVSEVYVRNQLKECNKL